MTQQKLTREDSFVILMISAVYISITCFWNLISLDVGIDIVFVAIVLCLITSLKHKIIIRKSVAKDFAVMAFFLLFISLYSVHAIIKLKQDWFNTLLVLREMYYFIVLYMFALVKCNLEKCARLIVLLELVSATMYFIVYFHGSPISPFANYSGSSLLINGIRVYRDYSPMPLLETFTCSYLLIGICKKKYIFNFRKDLISLFFIIFSIGIKFIRTRIITLFLSLIFTIYFIYNKKKLRERVKLYKWVGIVIGMTFLAFLAIPSLRVRFVEGLQGLREGFLAGNFSTIQDSGTYRAWLLRIRLDYLIKHNQLLFGMGAISSRNTTAFFKVGNIRNEISMIYNPDSSYLTLIARYGMIGTGYYISVLVYFIINFIKQRTRLSIAVAVFLISQIICGAGGNSVLAEYGPLLMAMMIGLTLSEKNNLTGSLNPELVFSDKKLEIEMLTKR